MYKLYNFYLIAKQAIYIANSLVNNKLKIYFYIDNKQIINKDKVKDKENKRSSQNKNLLSYYYNKAKLV